MLPLALLLAMTSCAPGPPRPAGGRPAGERPDELVVLVHGMGRSALSMVPLARTLRRAGYRVLNWGYSSTRHTIPELGLRLEAALRAHGAAEAHRVHFVGHSLGNIVVRRVLGRGVLSLPPGRVVMLAPPNRGARAADRLAPLVGWLFAPLAELRTAAMQAAPGLTLPHTVDVGIIAGRFDGKVAVEETYLEGMREHVVLPATHSFLMFRPDVHRLVRAFLRHGTFGERSSGR